MKKLPWLPRFMLEVFLSCNIVIVLYDQSTKLKHAYRYLLFQVVYVSNSGEQKVEKGSNEMKHFEKLTKKVNPNQLWTPKKQFCVYFPHFADGRSYESIPYPLLHLGYYSESRVKQNVSSFHKPKYKDFVMETNNSTPEVLEMLLARFEKTIPKSKVEGDFNCCIFQTTFLILLTLTPSLVYSFTRLISRSFYKFI